MNKATALWLLVAVTAISCAGTPPVAEPVSGASMADELARIEGIEPLVLADRTRVVLRSNAPLLYTSYEPDATRLVIEMQDVDVSVLPPLQAVPGDAVGEIRVVSEKRGRDSIQSRIEFSGLNVLDYSLRADGTNLVLDFLPSPFAPLPDPVREEMPVATLAPAAEPEAIEEERLSEPSSADSVTGPVAAVRPEAVAPQEITRRPAPPEPEPLPPASRLESVQPAAVTGGVQVDLHADGRIEYRTFMLKNPDRLVLDLIGVRNILGTRHLQVGADPVDQVRVAQFKADPEPVSRVVLDLVGGGPYHVAREGASLQVTVGPTAVLARQRLDAEQAALVARSLETADEDGIAEAEPVEEWGASAPATGSSQEPASTAPLPEPSQPASEPDHEPVPERPSDPAPSAADATLPSYDLGTISVDGAQELLGAARPADAGEVPLSLDDMGLEPEGDDYVLFDQEPSYRPQDVSAGLPPQFQPTTIAGQRTNYTGEKISVHFVEAELKNVFLFFSEFIGLNIVIDPEVRGKLTMHLDQVPWDQAFDVILRHQGLEKSVEGNVVRIATTEKLRAEAAQRQALKKAQEEEVDTVTFTQVLSYAKVDEVSPILIAGVRSERGKVVQDPRTNTLIITDVPDRQEAYQRLIDVLDKETEQVMIEARIVETDRNFEHNLGINWSVFAAADPALGTQTDLDFPHRASLNYDVNLPAAATAGTLGISLGNVLDSVTLDIALEAFENEGKVRILSSPRITTQNNQPATIEQGTQIPVVTTTAVEINVQYISASLKLEVTPQITADNTVIMDVLVENNSPDFVNRVGDVPPIITEKAQTQILVRDGATAVIGGIFKLSESRAEAGIPGFRKIPGLGWLFKNRAITKTNQELLVFITPKVLKGGA